VRGSSAPQVEKRRGERVGNWGEMPAEGRGVEGEASQMGEEGEDVQRREEIDKGEGKGWGGG